jgi:hypothetical protein
MLASIRTILVFICISYHLQAQAQNVGIKTTSPLTALDVNGDFSLRKATLTLPAGGSNNVDLSTNKYSVYDFAGGALTGGAQLYGFTGGTDGRIVTFYNNSTTGAIQIMDESHPGSASSAAANRIVTGSGNAAVIYQNGSVTLRYDGQKQRWTIVGSNYTDGLSATSSSVWSTSGTNIFNSNAGNVGIGLNTPLAKLHVKEELEALRIEGSSSYISFHDNAGVRKGFLQSSGDNLYLGTPSTNTTGIMQFYLQNFPVMTILPNTNVGIGTSNPLQRFTVQASGIGITQEGGAGGPQIGFFASLGGAYLQTHNNFDLLFSTNNGSAQMILQKATGNVGIGTSNPTYKLSVNGNVRAKEVVVETGWADYVFDENYKLKDLSEVEKFIQQYKHLPNIPSATEIETKGLNLGEVQKKMMEKIEELTLYVIELKKEIELLKEKK